MGYLKNNGGGFQHKPPKGGGKKHAVKVEAERVGKKQRSSKDEESYTRGFPLIQPEIKNRKVYPITSLILEYIELPPPRSLFQLAATRGLDSVPDEWRTRYQLEDWAGECDKYDAAINDQRLRKNWTAANETQQIVLSLTDRLFRELSQADPTDRELTQGLATMAGTVDKLLKTRLQVLEGLERPDGQSAVEVPKSQPISQLSLF